MSDFPKQKTNKKPTHQNKKVIKAHFSVNVGGMGSSSKSWTSRGLGGCGLANGLQHWPFAEQNKTTSDDPPHFASGEDFGPFPTSWGEDHDHQEGATSAAAAVEHTATVHGANNGWKGSSSGGGGSQDGGRYRGAGSVSKASSSLGIDVPSFIGVILACTYISAAITASISVACISKRPIAARTHAFVALVIHTVAAGSYTVFLWRWMTADVSPCAPLRARLSCTHYVLLLHLGGGAQPVNKTKHTHILSVHIYNIFIHIFI